MSLLQDYLEKTTPRAKPGQDAQVPPMLRQDRKKSRSGLRRFMPVMVIFFVVLGFSAYIFKASFQEVGAQPQKIQSNPVKALEVNSVKVPDVSVTPVAVNTPSVKIKPAVPPVKVEPVETIKLSALAAQIKDPEPPMTEKLSEPEPGPVNALQKIQAAMEEKKRVVPDTHSKPAVAGPEDYFNLGLAAQMRDDHIRAAGFYEKVLRLKPDHSRALLNLSVIYIKTGNNAKAMAILQKLHAREPENVDAMVNLGILFLHKKNYTKAESIFKKALDLQGNNTTVLFNLAYVNQMQNRMEQARKLYTRVSSIDKDNTSAFLATASILESQKKFSDALQCYVEALNTTEVKNSNPFRLKIVNRINLLQRIKAGSDHQIINSEETND